MLCVFEFFDTKMVVFAPLPLPIGYIILDVVSI